MDGRGRLYDNIFAERLWRTVKYENVYLHDYHSVPEAKEGLSEYFHFYNTERPHASLMAGLLLRPIMESLPLLRPILGQGFSMDKVEIVAYIGSESFVFLT